MHSYLHGGGIRCLCSLTAIVALALSGHAAQRMPNSGATNRAMSRLQRPRNLAMPPFSSNPAVNLGALPLLGDSQLRLRQQLR